MARINHYIPKCYQRNFDIDGIYSFDLDNIDAGLERINLKRSASRRGLYPQRLEDLFGEKESEQAPVLRNIISSFNIPTGNARDKLLQFISVQHKRIDGYRKELDFKTATRVKREFSNPSNRSIDELSTSVFCYLMENAINIHYLGIRDLDIALIKNTNQTKFVYSDHPVVFKNIKRNNPNHDRKGLAQQGLVIFLPINTQLLLILFDRMHYRIKGKKNKITIDSQEDVDIINLLQLYNCFRYVYISSDSEKYIKNLYESHSILIDKTRKKIVYRKNQYPIKPDSYLVPKLSLLNLTNARITNNVRDKRRWKRLLKQTDKARKEYFSTMEYKKYLGS